MSDRLTPSELAAECGVSRWTIYAAIEYGRLRAYRFGKKELRIRREDADRWIESCRIRRRTPQEKQQHDANLFAIARRAIR